jgi:hypothetical protein
MPYLFLRNFPHDATSTAQQVHNWLDHKFTEISDHGFTVRGDQKVPLGTGTSVFESTSQNTVQDFSKKFMKIL